MAKLSLSKRGKIQTLLTQATEGLDVDTSSYESKIKRMVHEQMSMEDVYEYLIKLALENIDESEPDWTYVASRIYMDQLYEEAAANRNYDKDLKYGDFYTLIQTLTHQGIYSKTLLQMYTKEEINHLASFICPARDLLFDYLGLHTLATRYLATDYEKNTYELPQERWMIIAMHLMQQEPQEKRLELVLEAYWALSHLYMTVATPTLTNAGKTHGQLSSCFIDTVDDSLQGIYDSNTDIAQLSKNGGGIGVYMLSLIHI